MELLQLFLFISSFYIFDGIYTTTIISLFVVCKILINSNLNLTNIYDPFLIILNSLTILLNIGYTYSVRYFNYMKSDPIYSKIIDIYNYMDNTYLYGKNKIIGFFFKNKQSKQETLETPEQVNQFLNEL